MNMAREEHTDWQGSRQGRTTQPGNASQTVQIQMIVISHECDELSQ